MELIDDPVRRRYRLEDGGAEVAYAEVDPVGKESILIKHTEVIPAHEGKGYGSKLVSAILDKARAEGKSVIPICPFAAAYIKRHKEFHDLVKPGFPLN